MNDKIIIRQMNLHDLDNISRILENKFDDFWNYNIFKSELENINSYYIIAIFENTILGFGGIWKSLDVAHITNIAIHKDFRRQGIGSLILDSLTEYVISIKTTELTLEVHEENISAQNLYVKHNFNILGKRKNYYNNKDAIIMTKLLKNK